MHLIASGIYYWGCARGFGRGTLYMKWGQQNQRFGTMRLRGEKDEEKEKKQKIIIYEIFENMKYHKILEIIKNK